jgi:glutathione S-transferase
MLTIHHLGVSQSERIIWLCEELALPYALERYERGVTVRGAPPEYQALHPIGTAPLVEIDGRMLAESGAIVEYIVNVKGGGRLQPAPGDPAYADWLFWFHFANGTLMPSQMIGMVLRAAPGAEALSAGMAKRAERGIALTEARLEEAPWLAGDDFTTADIMTAFIFTTMRAFSGMSLAPYPYIRAWLQRVGERPAYQRAMAAGDPGMEPMLT